MNEQQHRLAALFERLDAAALAELALIVAAAMVLITAEQRLLPWIAARLHGRARHYLLAAVPLLRLVIIALALGLAVATVLEPTLQNMVALLGAVGLALGFALKDYASSLIAGVVSAFEQPYRPGDWIAIDGIYGEVRHVGMRSVELVTPDDTRVTVPHHKIWDTPVSNANNGTPDLQCVAHFYVEPEHDETAALQALEDVALTSPFLALARPVSVVARELPGAVEYRVRAYPLRPGLQFRFLTDLSLRGRRTLAARGVRAALPWPERTGAAPPSR